MNPRPLIIVKKAKNITSDKALKKLTRFASEQQLEANPTILRTTSFGPLNDDAADKLNSIITNLKESQHHTGGTVINALVVSDGLQSQGFDAVHSHNKKKSKRNHHSILDATADATTESRTAQHLDDSVSPADGNASTFHGKVKNHSHKKKKVKKESFGSNGTAANTIDPSGLSNYDVPTPSTSSKAVKQENEIVVQEKRKKKKKSFNGTL